MLRGIQIQPDHIGSLALKVGGVRREVPLQAMRREAMPRPDSGHHHVGEPQGLRQAPHTPVRCPVLRPPTGPVENLGFHLRGQHSGRLPTVPAVEASQALGGKASTPPVDVTIATVERPTNLGPTGSVGQQQNTAGPSGIIGPARATVTAAFQCSAFHVGQRHGVLPRGLPVYTNVSVVTIH